MNIDETVDIGTYVGIINGIIILSNDRIPKGTGYLIDLSQVIIDERIFDISNIKPNFIVIINIGEEDLK